MSKVRLQVVMEVSELREIRRVAKRAGLTVSEWVRQVLRNARRAAPAVDEGRKLAAIEASFRHHFPTADMEEMLAQIESGYTTGL
ncbi:MAG: plasmid mobilization protein [Actinomycetota bacterium]